MPLRRLKILQVIHGYPMRYNAGSEVYTQGLSQALAEWHEVHVFTRQENAFLPEYAVQRDSDPSAPGIKLQVINMARARDGYRHQSVDDAFAHALDEVNPDVVHVGHLNHLSTSLLFAAKKRSLPVVFTLHDYWLMCPRGQFIQTYPENPADPWAVCDGQDDRKCAERCYCRYFSGDQQEYELDAGYWTRWVGRRMAHVREVCDAVDVFIAPAMYLLRRFRDEFGLPREKLVYLDYGFHLDRMAGRERVRGEPFTFAYIGTHIPAKGVDHLIQAFGQLSGGSRLRIWGRDRGVETAGLKTLARSLEGKCRRPCRVDGRIPQPGHHTRRVQPLRRHRGAVHLGRELAPGDPRGPAGPRPGDHGRLRRDGGVRPPRGERVALCPPGPRIAVPTDAEAG